MIGVEHRTPTLTDRIRRAVTAPATDGAGFDVHAELSEVLAGIGLSTRDTGGTITFRGADPIVPSTLRLGAAAGLGLVAKSAAVAALAPTAGAAPPGDGNRVRTVHSSVARLVKFHQDWCPRGDRTRVRRTPATGRGSCG